MSCTSDTVANPSGNLTTTICQNSGWSWQHWLTFALGVTFLVGALVFGIVVVVSLLRSRGAS